MNKTKQMRRREPLVSVIMPVYNAGEFLVEAINSVLNQSYTNFEILAVDDGAEDNSLEILRWFAKKDKRVRVYSYKRNRGLSFAANLAINKSKGIYLARFDADDIMPMDRLEKQVRYLSDHPEIITVGGQCDLIDDEGNFIGKKSFPLDNESIRKMSFIAMSLQAGSMMINRNLIPKVFKFYTSKYRYAEDHELLFKLFQYGKVANLADVLLYYRQHKNNSTKKINHKQIFKEIYNIRMRWFNKDMTSGAEVLVVNWLQYIAVIILPSSMIPVVFSFMRGTRRLNLSLNWLKYVNKIFPKFYSVLRAYLL